MWVRPLATAPSGVAPPGDVEAGPWYDDAPHATRLRASGRLKSAPGCDHCSAISMAACTALAESVVVILTGDAIVGRALGMRLCVL